MMSLAHLGTATFIQLKLIMAPHNITQLKLDLYIFTTCPHPPWPCRHLRHCRELEQAHDRCAAEQKATQGQVEALQKTLQDQEALLAGRVGRKDGWSLIWYLPDAIIIIIILETSLST